ncbi:MAG TPA: hypothetical protein VFG79_17555 [Solirubrobacter sp.]|nr:hypothetical protein [Solirubrobacter sp.]
MAQDLIPPPSPAGRPTPGSAPNLIELPPEPPRSGAEPAQRPDPGPSQFRNRFGFLIGALGGVFVVAALVLTAVLVSGGGSDDIGVAKNWSKWQPTDTSVDGAVAQIAEKVGREYRHADGKQLVKVTGGELGIDVALRASTGNISVIQGEGVLYQLDGLGPFGSIKGGTPSAQRLQLVRREALELALYTFRYLPDVEHVVTLLPPPPPEKGSPADSATSGLLATGADPDMMTAVFHRPGDLQQQLQIPLGHTLAAKAPPPEQMGGAEGKTVDALTTSNTFKWSLNTTQDNSPELVLDRP